MTGTFFATAAVGAAALIYPDRAADLFRKQDWMTPSAAWSTVFPERSASIPFVARGDAPGSMRPLPPQDANRPAAASSGPANPQLMNAAVVYPTSTASVAGSKVPPRELPWLPEPAKPAETPAAGPAPGLARAPAAPAAAPAAALAAAPAAAPAEVTAPSANAAATPLPKVAVAPPEMAPVPNPSAPPPSDAEVAELINRARTQIQVGDITGARLLLQRAASAREPVALMALAETYDPAMLARWGSRGIKGDAAKARELYQVAAESGLAEARSRVLAVR